MDRAFNILPGVLGKRGLKQHADAALVVHRVQEWFSKRFPSLVRYVHIRSVKDGILFIDCAHSIALQESTAAVEDLKLFLAQECPFATIEDIRIVRT